MPLAPGFELIPWWERLCRKSVWRHVYRAPCSEAPVAKPTTLLGTK